MSLRQQTVSGLLWSFLDDLARGGLLFLSGLVLARLLTPREFGLIGMTTLFIAISQSIVNSGFNQALIRKQDCTQADYSTVFYFNLLVSFALYLLLFFAAGWIARFFREPPLEGIIRALGLGLLIGALGMVQQTQVVKEIDFKLLTRISLVSSAIGGALGIALAYAGYGVWSLVVMTLSRAAVELALLWRWRSWRPSLEFRWASFRAMFSFGSRLLASSLITTLYTQLFNVVIGRFFSAAELGQFTQAQTFRNLPSQRLTAVVQRVSYPALATLQEEAPRLKAAYRRMLQCTMLATFALMLGMAACAEPLLITLVGEQWRPAIVYLQLLCFVGMFYPLHAINLNMFQVRGRSDLYLKLEVIKTVLAAPAMAVGVFWGIQPMIVTLFFISLAAYVLTAACSGRLIGYSAAEQIRDILPSFILAAVMAAAVYVLGRWLPLPDLPRLVVQVGAGATLTVGLAELTRLDSYLYLKRLALDKLMGGPKPSPGKAGA
ncbi:MAG TPA: lipopolysaccharide biosynthesis protein [Kiritimatiellia bacterium]|nr:lipopolysaccharide biosynthesis protein [Kiritimatiellia bacterium]HRZ12339.1 lipopolysaccharide biosynthesis protein [Kiritimatiellia bacterium]HSA17903.1 lipopolysaccharide biosynthesis protein [Kiritimatiellia bacterium]